MFLLSERYKLEIKWDNVVYDNDGICKFVNAKFTGPALKEADKVSSNDHIMLDFYRQYYVLTKNVYIGKFSWGEVEYEEDGSVFLKDAVLTHDTELNRVPKLHNNDYLVIDTSDHTTERHTNSLFYKTFVVNEDTELYNFRG